MFNFIVSYSKWGNDRNSFPRDRIFEYTEASIESKIKSGEQLNWETLIALPTAFAEEMYGDGDQIVRFGKITNIHVSGENVGLEYFFYSDVPAIFNKDLKLFASELGIEKFEFSRTHWAIKNVDLFRILLRNLKPVRSSPTVFRLAEPESIEPTLISAMMPFHPNFTPVYEKLKKLANTIGLRCRRADDIWENPQVIQDVVSLIDRSRVVICDCSSRNPNVFYEIGIAHTLGREVILITQSTEDIPFDLRHLRFVTYLNNDQGLEALVDQLKPRLESLTNQR